MCCALTFPAPRCMSGYAGHIAVERGMTVLDATESRCPTTCLVGACTRRCGISASACVFSQCLAECHCVGNVAGRHAILLAFALQAGVRFLLAALHVMLQGS